ncbi:hypothetical protein BST61_g4150 [Cercospora zeina]
MTRYNTFYTCTLEHNEMAPEVADTSHDYVPPLLRLPAEVRDEIYRFATPLAPNKWALIITPTTRPTEPPLLLVNRQIREEASAVYYKHNKFIFAIQNLDAKHYISWCQALPARRLTANVAFHLTYEPLLSNPEEFRDAQSGPGQKVFVPRDRQLWPNLMFWLERYYWREGLGLPNVGKEYPSQYSNIAAVLFEMVGKLGKVGDMSWASARDVLEPMQRALGIADSAWFGYVRYD